MVRKYILEVEHLEDLIKERRKHVSNHRFREKMIEVALHYGEMEDNRETLKGFDMPGFGHTSLSLTSDLTRYWHYNHRGLYFGFGEFTKWSGHRHIMPYNSDGGGHAGLTHLFDRGVIMEHGRIVLMFTRPVSSLYFPRSTPNIVGRKTTHAFKSGDWEATFLRLYYNIPGKPNNRDVRAEFGPRTKCPRYRNSSARCKDLREKWDL